MQVIAWMYIIYKSFNMPISGLIHLLDKVSMALFDSLLWHLCHCMYSLCLYVIQVLYTSAIKLKKTCSDVTNAGNEEYFFIHSPKKEGVFHYRCEAQLYSPCLRRSKAVRLSLITAL